MEPISAQRVSVDGGSWIVSAMATIRSEVDWESDSLVQLRVPARVEQLAVIRAATATVSASFDLDIDAIADARLAVDEASTELMTIGVPEATLDCRFDGGSGRLWVRCATTIAGGDAILEHGLSWYVLRSIVTQLSVGADGAADGAGPRQGWIEFCIENEHRQAG